MASTPSFSLRWLSRHLPLCSKCRTCAVPKRWLACFKLYGPLLARTPNCTVTMASLCVAPVCSHGRVSLGACLRSCVASGPQVFLRDLSSLNFLNRPSGGCSPYLPGGSAASNGDQMVISALDLVRVGDQSITRRGPLLQRRQGHPCSVRCAVKPKPSALRFTDLARAWP